MDLSRFTPNFRIELQIEVAKSLYQVFEITHSEPWSTFDFNMNSCSKQFFFRSDFGFEIKLDDVSFSFTSIKAVDPITQEIDTFGIILPERPQRTTDTETLEVLVNSLYSQIKEGWDESLGEFLEPVSTGCLPDFEN